MPTCGSPKLFAAYRVLHRQSVPWHPPCALIRLILPVHINYCFLRLLRTVVDKDCLFRFFPVQFSRCVEVSTFVDPSKRYRNHHFVPSDSVSSLANYLINSIFTESFAGLSGSCSRSLCCRPRIWLVFHLPFLPRKEVIQPHLPIRLPCYDFTPVIGLTFDGCLR